MKKIFVVFCIITFIPAFIFAQELDATITLNVEQLPTASRERIENFADQIRDYLNNTKFTSKAWEGDRIKCTFNIFFNGSSDEISYSAQLVVSSQRPIEGSGTPNETMKLKVTSSSGNTERYDVTKEGTQRGSLMMSILDNSWSFKYQKNQAMYFNQTDFDQLTSMLDFYAYIIIGFDFDSYYKLGGTEYFQKALDIAAKGGSSSPKGWQYESNAYNRRALVDNLLNAKYQQFRQDYFDYYYNGLDLFHTEDQKQSAYNNIVKLIKNLEKMRDQIDTRSVLMKVFFDAKAGEFIEYLKNYPDKSIFNTLKKLDPPHISKYDEAMK